MTTKAEWTALAERCEKATGPDREIDGDIAHAAKQFVDYLPRVPERPWLWAEFVEPDDWECWEAPEYTASLYAIVALIGRGELPAAWVWTLGQNIHHRTWGVSINNLDSDGVPYSVCWGASSHSPALALCAAFCRAMSEKAA